MLEAYFFLTYASYNKLYGLVSAIDKYDLEIFLNEDLIQELERKIPRVIQVKGLTPKDILDQIYLINTFTITT